LKTKSKGSLHDLIVLITGIQGRVDIINSTLGKAMGGAMVNMKIFSSIL
jgi:hypothetical protein